MTRHALFIGLALLVGCGSNGDTPSPNPAPEEVEETEQTGAPEPDAPEAPTETADGVTLVGPLVLGEPVEVTVPPVPGPEGQRHYLLAIAADHGVRCDAHAEHEGEGRDAQMALYRDEERIAANSDAGEGFDARIDFEAEAGTYGVRVWEWLHRDATLTLTCRRHEVAAEAAAEPSPSPTE